MIGFSSLVSLIRGFVREALSLVTWGCAFFVASHYYTYLSVWFTGFEDELVPKWDCHRGTVYRYPYRRRYRELRDRPKLVEKTGLSGTLIGCWAFGFGALRGVLIVAAILSFSTTFTGVVEVRLEQVTADPAVQFYHQMVFELSAKLVKFLAQSVSALRCGLTRKRRMCGELSVSPVLCRLTSRFMMP